MLRKTSWLSCVLLGIALLVPGCGNAEKETIDAAITAAQGAIAVAQGEAAKYVPDQLQAAQKAVQIAKDALTKKDYKAALAAAQDAANKARDLAAATAAKKDEWTRSWTEMSASIPKSLNQVRAKLDAYSRGARMPVDMDKDKLADAKIQYEQLKQAWADASAAATQGNTGDALKKASSLKEALAKLMEMLGIES
jgi:hypothetical protein